jgi:phosphohistidine phosphatase
LNIENEKRILLILRHGKSDIEKGIPDFNRQLNKYGKNQAVAVGKLIRNLDLIPDYIISSSAKRAVDTTEIVVKFSNYDGKIDINPSLYLQNSEENYFSVLANLSNKYYKVLVIGHNPSVENLIEKLTNRIEMMRTCSFARIDIKIKSWSEIIKYSKDKIEFFGIWHSGIKDEYI